MTVQHELLDAIAWVAAKGWAPATGGNFSARVPDGYLITASGRDKSTIAADDLLVCDAQGKVVSGGGRPSAESDLHAALYRLDSSIGCVLHTHSVAATVLSRRYPDGVTFTGFEMQKALQGNTTHDASITLPVVPNSQDMAHIASAVEAGWPMPWGFLVAGHGLYTAGKDIAVCRRHLEGLEFLMACVLEETRWER